MRKIITLSLLALFAAVFVAQPAPVSAQAGILCSRAAGFNVGSFQYNTCVDYANDVAQLSTDNARVEEIRGVFAPIRADYNRLGPFPFSSDNLFEQQERREWIQTAGNQVEASAGLLDELETIIQRRQNFLTEAAQYQNILSLLAGDSRAIDAARALNARLVNLPAERERLQDWRNLLNDSRTLTTQVYSAEVLTPEDAERRAEEQIEPDEPEIDDIDPTVDSDDDLIPDALDDCRFVPGPPENNGCPVEDDAAPEEGETAPDEAEEPEIDPLDDFDDDGVLGDDDECEFAPGPAENNGCPVDDAAPEEDEPEDPTEPQIDPVDDFDDDGVVGDDDECEFAPGPAENNGCPVDDAAGDEEDLSDDLDDVDLDDLDLDEELGGLDAEDLSDDEPVADDDLQEAMDDIGDAMGELGESLDTGDPDAELQEAIDEMDEAMSDLVDLMTDECPDLPGPAINNGCPLGDEGQDPYGDDDGDGVLNAVDICVDEPGVDFNFGCPERVTDYDADGVGYVLDDCPLVAGPLENKGCPVDDDLPFEVDESAGSIPEPDDGDFDFGQLPPCDPNSTGADSGIPCEVVPNNNGPQRACDGSTGTVPEDCFEDSAATQTFSGTFNLHQSDAGGCGFSAAPDTGGSITITVDYATRTATANIEGGGSGIRANLYCDGGYGDMTWSVGYSANLSGTIQPIGESSQYILFEGDVSGSGSFTWSNCRLENGEGFACPAGGGGGFTLPIVVDGNLLADNTAFGEIQVDAGALFTEGSWTIP